MGRTLLVERAKSCKENQLVNQNKIIRNIYIVLSFEEPKIVWIASATCVSSVYWSHEFSPCVLWPLMIGLILVLLTFFPLASMVLIIGK